MGKAVYITIIILTSLSSWSQDLRNYHIHRLDESDGLPSNEVYHIVQDQKGFIWIATDNGISKFNGVEHEIYDAKNGVSGNCAFHLFLQPDTSIVAVTEKNTFIKIKDNQTTSLIDRDSLSKRFIKTSFPFSFGIDSMNNQWVGTRHGYQVFSTKSELLESSSDTNYYVLNLMKKDFGLFTFFSENPKPFQAHEFISVLLDGKLIYQYPVSENFIQRSYYPSNNDRHILVPLENSFLLVDSNLNVQEYSLDQNVISTYLEGDDLFIGTSKSGVYCYTIVDDSAHFRYKLFDGFSISSVLKDDDGRFWFSLLEDGIRYIDTHEPEVVCGKENEIFTSINHRNGGLLLGTQSGKLLSIGGQSWEQILSKHKIWGLDLINNNIWISGGDIYKAHLDTNSLNFEIIDIYNNQDVKVGARKILQIDSNQIVIQSNYTLYRYDAIKKTLDQFFKSNQELRSIVRINSELFAATPDSLFCFDLSSLAIKSKFSIENIIYLFNQEGRLGGVTSSGEVLYLLNDKFVYPNLPQSKKTYSISAALYSNGLLHLATNRKVLSFRMEDSPSLINSENLSNIKIISNFKDTLFFVSNNKVYKKSILDFGVSIPSLEVRSILLDEHIINHTAINEINYDSKNIQILLDLISFENEDPIIRYRIKGQSENYNYTYDPYILISSLPPGEQIVEISISSDEVNYSDPLFVKFYVNIPYWQKTYFIVIIVLTLLVLIFLIFQFRIRQLKRKHQLMETIATLKSQSLKSQLNPHLIFNVLNSIQGLVSEGSIEKANLFIARFSKFLRSSLRYSKENKIGLTEELNLTRQYIDIEKIRFGEEFEFYLENNIQSSSEIEVPPLIIQPIIENAIKHGLMPSKESIKTVKIIILQIPSGITIRIEDNGVGFSSDFQFNDGMRITEERLQILNKNNDLRISKERHPTVVELIINKHEG